MGKNRKSYGGGIFDGLTEAVSNLIPGNKKENSVNASKNANASKNNSEQNGNVQKEEAKVETMSYGFKQTPGQTGGVAPTGYSVPGNQRQPSEQIMEWATTAGAPTPTSGMRNVAHGGRRNRTRRNRRNRNRSRRNKTGGSRRNRNRSRRNKTGGNRRNRNRSRRNRRN